MNQQKAHILYVEDDDYLAFVTRDNLELKGYQVTHCHSGNTAKECIETGRFDLCLLDIMLPGLDGFGLARLIRQRDENIPILFISAKSMKEDKLRGFRTGADDYITKPYSIEELIMRIEVFLKRSLVHHPEKETESVIRIGSFTFEPLMLLLSYEGRETRLTDREAELLKFFCERTNQVIRRNDILEKVWGNDNYFNGRSLDVFISRLRKYLADDPSISLDNVHGVGYVFKAKVENGT